MRETLTEIGRRMALQEIEDIAAFRRLLEGPYPQYISGDVYVIKFPERWVLNALDKKTN